MILEWIAIGDLRKAIGYYEEALTIRRKIGDRRGEAADSFNVARLHAQQEEPDHALPLVQQAAHLGRRAGRGSPDNRH